MPPSVVSLKLNIYPLWYPIPSFNCYKISVCLLRYPTPILILNNTLTPSVFPTVTGTSASQNMPAPLAVLLILPTLSPVCVARGRGVDAGTMSSYLKSFLVRPLCF